jgi:tetratricopeptide (TPR) repeat protein
MGRLEEAKGRLDRALARLDEAANRPSQASAAGSNPDTEAALEASRLQCASLEAKTHEVSERLDTAIEQLQAVLKEDGENGAG